MAGGDAGLLEAAFVLHTRPWRESSLIVELLTPGHGRVGVVARGGRRGQRGGAGDLQPFTLLQVAWRGRGELRTLLTAEPERHFVLAGERLFTGMYLNELLLRLLQREAPQPEIFTAYGHALAQLGTGAELEPLLRRFEFGLLADLGYGFPLDQDADGLPIVPTRSYCFAAERGLLPLDAGVREARQGGEAMALHGADLLALADGCLEQASVRRAAKLLARQALAPLLGNRPLRARELFRRRRGGANQG